jgi:hypothetical protein
MAKQLSHVTVDAVADIRRVAGHETFAPPGYDSLLELSKLTFTVGRFTLGKSRLVSGRL